MKHLKATWTWFSHASGIFVVSMSLALGVVYLFSKDMPVVESGPTKVHNSTIKRGGTLVYSGTLHRNESCPGASILTFVNHPQPAGSIPVVVTLRRPTPASELALVYERTRYIDLPQAIYPGTWTVTIEIQSDCPTRQRVDQIASFELEVVP